MPKKILAESAGRAQAKPYMFLQVVAVPRHVLELTLQLPERAFHLGASPLHCKGLAFQSLLVRDEAVVLFVLQNMAQDASFLLKALAVCLFGSNELTHILVSCC